MNWLNTVVWDDDMLPETPLLTELILDPSDEHLIFEGDIRSRADDRPKLDEDVDEIVDPFNVSNDHFYNKRKGFKKLGKLKIIHSAPAVNLDEVR